MNKPKIVIITLLMFVMAAALSAFSTEGRTSVHPVLANAHDLQIESESTPTISYTPEAFIPVEMSALDQNGASRGGPCGEVGNQLLYGCTAFCRDDDPIIDDKSCNHEQQLSYPYGNDSVPLIDVENDYLPDVLSQEMGPSYENITLRAGAIAMRSFAWQQFEELSGGKGFNNSTQFQAFIPYKFNTLNPEFPGSTCGLPDPLLNQDQRKMCHAIAPRYYISSVENGDFPAQANHFADVPYRTEDASFDDPALVGVEDPISTEEEPCVAQKESVFTYGLSQKGANRWARGNRCGIATPGESWSVKWTRPEQILFHYFTRVHLRDTDNDKKVLSPDWRWNPLDLRWAGNSPQPPTMHLGGSYLVNVTLQNTGISDWPCQGGNALMPPPVMVQFQLRYWWTKGTAQTDIRPVAGAGRAALCDVAPGQSVTVPLLINDVPNWGPGVYTLKFDVYDRIHNSWFSQSDSETKRPGWPTYDVNVQVTVLPTASPTPTSCGFDGC